MTDPREYKVPEDILAAHLEGEAVLLNMETKNYYRLNETAAVVFKGLERGLGREALVDDLCAKFDVERADAAEAVEALLADLAARGLAAPAAE
ncbi:PqqD family protein [Longimicrobium terrae]|uniref:Putative methyltransferase n=1 Tax=Longimicrobium terrae TaxID=1639882 RepID=A0A841GR58_9BACT|nr:PqqD family protein [Longimicrobium terrae]MBB4635668.1 putative methyltransferase [Longimicrobium terrae]MBB6070062.1 putative methyltransferase [Longimicrobium terrae]NNC32966.1 PqqD family protein [Longimicrobium terrae]